MRIRFLAFLEDPRSWCLDTILILGESSAMLEIIFILGDYSYFGRKVNDFGNYSASWKLFSFLDIVLVGGTWDVRGKPVYGFYNDMNNDGGQATLYTSQA